MIEGLAEYMSQRPLDNQTAIWMRDRVAMNKIPTIRDISRNPQKFFPYRYGHALWAYLTGKWGDAIIKPLQILTIRKGMKQAFDSLLGFEPDSVSTLWANSLKDAYKPYMKDTIAPAGKEFTGRSNLGSLVHSPVVSPDGKYMTFISNKNVISIDVYLADLEKRKIIARLSNGFRNSYKYDLGTGEVTKLTKYYTGIIGVTEYSPVLSVNGKENTIAYSLYEKGKYHLYYADEPDLPEFPVDPDQIDRSVSVLPPFNRISGGQIVSRNLNQQIMVPKQKFKREPYDPRFKLEFVGTSGIGIGASQYGTGLAGGVSLLFSDILKQNLLYGTVRVTGQIEDIGGQLTYVNREQRFNWGTALSHIPYRTQGALLTRDTLMQQNESVPVVNLAQIVQRTFEDKIALFSQYPVSVNLRAEAGASMARYSYAIDSIANIYTTNGQYLGRDKVDLSGPPAQYIGSAYVA